MTTHEELLTEKGVEALSDFDDAALRNRARDALAVCKRALGAVDAVELSPHELADPGTPDLSTWNALASDTSALLTSVKEAITQLRALFPSDAEEAASEFGSDDIDIAFEMGGGTQPGAARDAAIDLAVEQMRGDPSSRVGSSIRALTGMLEQDILGFGNTMRRPEIASNRWMLLGALHELKMNCAQCLDAVAAAVVQELSSRPPELLLKRYANATGRSLRLRADLRDLRFEVERLKAQAELGLVDAIGPRVEGMLGAFEQRDSYGFLRPSDKKQILEFRWWARQGAADARRRLEDFHRFLEVMGDINRRELLVRHDLRRIEEARMLLLSEEPMSSVFQSAKRLYGRSDRLDGIILEWRRGRTPRADELAPLLDEAEALCRLG